MHIGERVVLGVADAGLGGKVKDVGGVTGGEGALQGNAVGEVGVDGVHRVARAKEVRAGEL